MGILDKLFGRKKPVAAKTQHVGHDMVSLVILSQTCPTLTLDSVRVTLDSIFPSEFLPPREAGNFVIDGAVPGAQYLVQCTRPNHQGMFMIQNVPGPYSEFSDYLNYIEDPEIREVAVRQQCWLSVDMVHQHTTAEDAYRFIGATLALLAPPDAAVLVHPSMLTAVPFTNETRRQLAAGELTYGRA